MMGVTLFFFLRESLCFRFCADEGVFRSYFMLPLCIARRFLKKFHPVLVSVVSKRFCSQKITKQRKPIKFIDRKIKRSSKLPVKEQKNVEPKVYKRDIITNIYNILKYSTWDSAQEQLENLSIKWESYTVTQVLKTHPPMEKAWLFFIWASKRTNFKHDQYTYTTMLDIFGEARRISSMMFVFEQMKEKGIKTDVVTYTSLMHWMSNDGDIDGAISLWKEMRAKGCKPTVVSYTAYMKILFDHKRINEGTSIYKEMLESGLSPNCHTYTVLMEYLACSGKYDDALEVFQKMQDAGVQPDKAACNILIEICCRTGATWVMMRILQYMKENFLVLRYTIYKKALETFKIARESDVLLKEVNQHFSAEELNVEDNDRHDTVPPNANSIIDNGIVLSLLNKKNLVSVDSLLTSMMSTGVYLKSEVISKIIEVNSVHGRKNGALLAYNYSVKLGIDIDRTAYLALIGLFIRSCSFTNVVEIVEKMAKRGLSLGTHLNSLLIFRLGCNKEPVSAAKVFNLLPDEVKGTSEYTALIAAYFSSGNMEKGIETFELMKGVGVNVALGTYSVLVAGLEKCGRFREMEYYQKEKKKLQSESCSRDVSMEEMICNLLFSCDLNVGYTK